MVYTVKPQRITQLLTEQFTLRFASDGYRMNGRQGRVFEQQTPDQYKELTRIPTVKGARTSFFSAELGRLYLAVRRQGSHPASI
jgi:hypothetical protein